MQKADSVNEDYYPGEDSDDLETEEEQTKEVLEALNALDIEFKNIDDDDDDEEVSFLSVYFSCNSQDEVNEEDEEEEPVVPVLPKQTSTSKQVETLSTRMNQMIEIMEQQSRYIAELRNEIYNLKGYTREETISTQKNLVKVEENCKKAIEQSFIKHESSLMMRDKYNREHNENLVKMFNQMARSQVAITESTLKENLLKICNHKAFIESICQSLLIGIQKSLEHTFRKSIEDVMIPSYERVTQEMFVEMGKAFQNGTKEYTRAFDAYMKQYGAVQFQMAEFTNIVHNIPQQVRQSSEISVIPILNSGFQDIRQRMDKFQTKMLGEVMEQVKSEIKNGFERQTMSLEDSVFSVVQRSQAETPAPTIYDQQESIRQQLAHNEINKAFHQALISSDLTLLEFTIEKADIKKVFNPCPLEQSVLLSLIQQLTADMSKYTENKNSYLNEAITSLNIDDPISKEHAPKILRELTNTFQAYRNAHPNSKFSSSMKMMMMVAQSMMRM